MVIPATPFTRPPGSLSTTRPSTVAPRGATTTPSAVSASLRWAVKVSPVLWVLVEMAVVVRTFTGVPSASVTERGAGGGGAVPGVAAGAGVAARSAFVAGARGLGFGVTGADVAGAEAA